MRLDIDSLRTSRALVESGSFTGAASRLYLIPSAVDPNDLPEVLFAARRSARSRTAAAGALQAALAEGFSDADLPARMVS